MKQSDYAERLKNIGRNAPCPCGSGKKYKKCHLIKDEKAMRKERLAQEKELNNTEEAQAEKKQESKQKDKDINKVAPKPRLSKKQRLAHHH